MKKRLFSVFVLTVFMLSFFSVIGVKAETDIEAGSLIKTADSSTIYYVGEDGKIYVFPNSKTYFSWYSDFTGVTTVTNEQMSEYTLGGNVHYKPGSVLIKTPSSSKVYAVAENGKIKWIKTETMAKKYYGDNWNLLVDDVPDGFMTGYTEDGEIDEDSTYNPDELEEEYPTISHNKFLRLKQTIKNRISNLEERRCEYLKNAFNRLQERADRWGVEIPSIGDDYLAECTASEGDDSSDDTTVGNGNGNKYGWIKFKKVTVCHQPLDENLEPVTITVSANALPAHLKHGDYLGECEGDSDSNTGDNTDGNDTTPPVISNIEINENVSTTTITWTTSEATDENIKYSTSHLADTSSPNEETESATSTSHSMLLEGLTASTTYYFIIECKDESGNVATTSELYFTTLQEKEVVEEDDETAPVISELEVATSTEAATISWKTDEAATSKIYYATEELETASTIDEYEETDLVLTRNLELTNLSTSTTYYFYVESSDEAGNVATSSESSFFIE